MEEAHILPWRSLPRSPCELIRASCSRFVRGQTNVTIDDEAVQRYAAQIDIDKLHTMEKRMFPLNFPTANHEINFLCVLHLLNFGSGWRRHLHHAGDKGAFETISFGVMGMYITGDINATFLINLSLFDVASLFGLKISRDFELQPGIHSDEATELRSLADAIVRVLNQAGATLRKLQCDDLAQFILQQQKVVEVPSPSSSSSSTSSPSRPSAQDLVSRLIAYFPSLQDAYIFPCAAASTNDNDEQKSGSEADDVLKSASVQGYEAVYILKKAQIMVCDLYLRFSSEIPQLNFHDIDSLTVFSDNVIPAVLNHHAVLRYDAGLQTQIQQAKDVTNRKHECALRAGAIVAVDAIVAAYNALHATDEPRTLLTTHQLDYHLWASGKEPDIRKIPRHATQSIFY